MHSGWAKGRIAIIGLRYVIEAGALPQSGLVNNPLSDQEPKRIATGHLEGVLAGLKYSG